jgi:hypothetical protein
MKKIFCMSMIVGFMSCSTEKAITKTEPVLQINEKSKISSGYLNDNLNKENVNTKSTLERNISIREELTKNGIPVEINQFNLSNWKEYYNSFSSKENQITLNAKLYCYRKLVENFSLYTLSLSPFDKKSVYSVIKTLVANKWSGYKVIYDYLNFFKNNESDFTNWREIQISFKSYGKVLTPIKSNQPDSEVLNQNPEFKKEVLTMIQKLEENNSYVKNILAL